MRCLAAIVLMLGLTFSGCATTSDMKKMDQKVTQMEKDVRAIFCLIAGSNFSSEVNDCMLAGAVCEERAKRLLDFKKFTPTLFVKDSKDTKDNLKSPMTLQGCRKAMEVCVINSYGKFMAIAKARGCK